MNKTIIININGIVFHIEEDAYEVLISYMNQVKKHFGYSADSYEIVGDIENRLAEMFNELLAKENKQVIVLADVTTVTQQMGSPSDFEIPEEESDEKTVRVDKRLFRDTEDRIFGGVCAGIGHYFDLEARWIRLIFLLSFFFFGTGFFLYLILWIVMPKALSRADKLAMKGEAATLQNFKKNFDEEVAALKENLLTAQKEVQPLFQRLGRFIEQLFSHFGKFLGKTGMVIIKIIGGFSIAIGVLILFSLFVALLAVLGVWNSSELPIFPFSIVNPEYQAAIYISAFLVVIIPLVSLILFAVRVLFNKSTVGKNGSFALLMVWLVALSIGIYYGFKTAGEFKQEARFSQTQALKTYPTFYLQLNKDKFLTKEDSLRYHIDGHYTNGRIVKDNKHNSPNNMRLNIEASTDNSASVIVQYISNGKNFETALAAVKRIKYRVIQQDSVLLFDEAIHLIPAELWRNQRVKVTLRVPQNSRLVIQADLNEYLEHYNLYDCIPTNAQNYQADGSGAPSTWLMGKEGLTCTTDSTLLKK
jgi:phage shock protein PspC (stress-responsive transcriptional regulator)